MRFSNDGRTTNDACTTKVALLTHLGIAEEVNKQRILYSLSNNTYRYKGYAAYFVPATENVCVIHARGTKLEWVAEMHGSKPTIYRIPTPTSRLRGLIINIPSISAVLK